MINKLVVFDPGIKSWMRNQIFDYDFARHYPGALIWVELARMLQEQGIQILTIDNYLTRTKKQTDHVYLVVMITQLSTDTIKIINNNQFISSVCVCLEPPLIAWEFYHNLSKYSLFFQHIFTFSGAQERVRSQNTIFHPILWPYEYNEQIKGPDWSERLFLTLINSNGRAKINVFPEICLNHPKSTYKNLISYLKPHLELRRDPWFGRELYLERLNAIEYFSNNSSFHLYGYGWEKPVVGVNERFNTAVKQCYKGTIEPYENKFEILSNYKFAICFENSQFPGYITEKILDCFHAGCIPIYFGAPDIPRYIPTDTFIDFNNFHSYEELELFLTNIDEKTANYYIYSARKFLISEQFDLFNGKLLARNIFSAIINSEY